MKRSQLRRKTRLRAESAKQRRHRAQMKLVTPELIDRAGMMCECGEADCFREGQHAHHVIRRSQGGTDELSNLKWLSWECHARVHANPKWAFERGLLDHAAGRQSVQPSANVVNNAGAPSSPAVDLRPAALSLERT